MIRAVPAAICFMLLTGGCATTRTVNLSTKPADATLYIEGIQRGRGPITETFTFDDARLPKRIRANRQGFDEADFQLYANDPRKNIVLELKHPHHAVNVIVGPVAGVVKMDGQPLKPDPVNAVTSDVEFSQDSKGFWIPHTITVERTNFRTAQQQISYYDLSTTYNLTLDPLRKDLTIATEPKGASVYLNGVSYGPSPVSLKDIEFPVDPATNNFVPKKLKVIRAGYDPIEGDISWDDGQTNYDINFVPRTKTVRIRTEPPDSVVKIEGKEIKPGADGVVTLPLPFPPTNNEGELRSYTAVAMRKPDGEWQPGTVKISWDGGKADYTIALKEIMTRKMPLITADWTRVNNAWEVSPRVIDTTARKDTVEDSQTAAPMKLTNLPAGSSIGSLSVSPDGTQIVFSVFSGSDKNDFRSQLFLVRTDGSAVTDVFSNGKSLDLTPSFSPGGDQVVYSSNQLSKKMCIYQASTTGATGQVQLTDGESNDLSPSLDSDPKPRLYWQRMIDNRNEPQMLSNILGTTLKRYLTADGGTQPRISPRNDAVVFTATNTTTGKRDLFLVDFKGGVPQNLTNTPDIDDFDPAWNADGSKIAYASDGGVDVDQNRNTDIYMMDVKSRRSERVTTNGSLDDCPAWDPTGRLIYFRSNRGIDWGIWKVSLPAK